jgi:hypothetical protein
MRKLFTKKASNTGFSYRTKCESLLEQFFYLRKIVKQTVLVFFIRTIKLLEDEKQRKEISEWVRSDFKVIKGFFTKVLNTLKLLSVLKRLSRKCKL